jgi:hypothetical protein
MKGSLWRKNAAAAQFRGLWHFGNRRVNVFIYRCKMAVLDRASPWQIGNYGRFSRKQRGTHSSRIRLRAGLGRLAEGFDVGAA